jgi:hypothetical protein
MFLWVIIGLETSVALNSGKNVIPKTALGNNTTE